MRWYLTSIGKKYVMAITGFIMVFYVVVHLLGNLSIFSGPDAINAYAVNLRKLGPLLWLFRAGLLIVAVLHIVFGILVTIENRKARPIPYLQYRTQRTNIAAESMIWSGSILGLFIIYHIMHFTLRLTNPGISHFIDFQGRDNVFVMVVLSFQQLPIALTYVVAMVFLALHLFHGIQSLFQSLGLNSNSGRTLPVISRVGMATAVVVGAGFSFIPISMLLKLFPS